ncbi:2-amino-4-hydroxy-6-hydroxymethyldihydropteridine diphosphokinase [Brevibacterium jeotgali]|uniref:Bifunctional folate synthesis protein n=1 Tax=Brevibacterium jeotgali TaxID=1262550 RepID=A0A2H1L0Y1_9MICO|nr:2-amino-4-hydroxy-6-hydroxymethyldihydropteridine diphosphokinase [Brevibacterium jeotgali]TWC02078.1 dihydroneopterin aldolase/2-amino-4-hydroxy-6-hydroxymethyldihydropteridine diphosphokinase [Brevibacterium jeotgali]SMY10571.1 dihydroneopterin aldolase / 2-amino-4-hydroxy-6-hydroxymethyldihydropteridine diphosphokinase [Brevibacterium jeotgali]
MTDEIRLTGLTIRGHHGVFDFEKRDGQDFVVDVVLRGDLSRPAATDDLADTTDYGALADDLAAIVAGKPYDLIEALAGALADRCLAACAEVEVTVRKPQAPIAHAFTDVAVTVRRTRAPTQWRAVIALGANLGDALATLQDAAHALDLHPRIDVVVGSSVYVTVPVGGIDQPDFHNAAVIVDTTLPPHQLLAVCQGIEVGAGRTRDVRWGPRTLDLDLVHLCAAAGAVHDQDAAPPAAEVRLADPVLTLPHPRAGERAFVLAPWADLQPDALVDTPRGRERLTTALAHADDADGVQRAGALVWTAEQTGRSMQPAGAGRADLAEHGDPAPAAGGDRG